MSSNNCFQSFRFRLNRSFLPLKVVEISENKLVVSISSDLPLESSECSLLGKGLGFIPTNKEA